MITSLLAVALVACVEVHERDVDAGVDACVPAPLENVDLLFVVDPSGYAVEMQWELAARYEPMLRALLTGDLDGDGAVDAEPARSIHAGVILSDLGTAGVPVSPSGCFDALDGEDGVLRMAGGSRFVELGPGDDPSAAAVALAEPTLYGNDGCSFQQHLEAALKALSPSTPNDGYTPPAFLSGEAQGDRANAGFLRADGVLAIVVIAHHDDESVLDPEIYVASSATYPESPGHRAWHHPELLQPIERFADGLLALGRRPGDLVMGLIAGFPSTRQLAADAESLAEVRDDPWMVLHFSPDRGGLADPVCSGIPTPAAWAGQRYVDLAIELDRRGARVSMGTVCSPTSFTNVTERVAADVLDALRPACR